MSRPLRLAVAFGAFFALAAEGISATAPVKLIFDTDYSTDCDDPGALAVLHALADNGEVEILATGASTAMAKAPGAIDVVNTYYGRPDLPIGATKKAVSYFSSYVDHLFDNFPHDTPLSSAVPDAVAVYREILAAQPDDSVVFVTVGYLTNMAELLKSAPDAHSPLNGKELVALKVKEWACMGGNFFHVSTNNVNFTRDKESAYYAIRNFPKTLTFLPREVASEPSPLRAGQELTETAANNPVLVAYQKYFGRATGLDRHVADPATVLYAVRGAHDYWDLVTTGWMDIQTDGTFTWNPAGTPNADGTMNHQYLQMKGGYGVYSNQDYVEGVIRVLLKQAPGTTDGGTGPTDPVEPTPVDGTIAWYRFEEDAGGSDPGAAIVNHGDAGAALDLTNTGGPDGRDNSGAGGYGVPGMGGHGFAFDVLASGDGVYHSSTGGAPTGGGLTTAAAVPQSALQGPDGAFTYEALIKIGGITAEQTILSHDGSAVRGFLFRITGGLLSFYTGSGSVAATIPTTGAHAFSADEWFHVAITYSGAGGVADNVRFYWTALGATSAPAPAPAAANLIGTATLAADLSASSSNPLGIGTTTRSPFRFELAGLVDEVGICGFARSAEALASFGPPPAEPGVGDADGDGLPDAWETAHGMEAGVDNHLGDPDADGVPNLLEFALGLDPRASDLGGLPVAAVEGAFLTLAVTRSPEAAVLDFVPERSTDLLSWATGEDAVVVLEDTPALLRFRDAEPLAGGARRFLRVRVER